MNTVPVITIDGASGCGKGTIARRLARHLSWHLLDSGAFYRTIAWAVLNNQIADDPQSLANLLDRLQIEVINLDHDLQIFCNGIDISLEIRSEQCAITASLLATRAEVRSILLQTQRDFRQPPGLIADGRDMGTVVFPDAILKFFFHADIEERAKRRYLQLKQQEIHVSLSDIRENLTLRDQRDRERVISPTQAAPDAIWIDTTHSNIDQVFAQVMQHYIALRV